MARKKSLRGRTFYWWTSASEVWPVKFVRWQRMRMHTGGEDTNKIGVGAVVSSRWLFGKELMRKVPRGLRIR